MIKNILILLPVIFFLLNNPANALNIGVAKIDDIIEKSYAMKKAKKAIISQKNKYQEEITKEEEDLNKKFVELEKQSTKLSEKAINKKKNKLVEEANELKSLLQKRQESLRNAEVEIITKIGKEIEKIIIAIKKNKKYDIILSDKQTILFNDSMDISEEILKKLNSELPKIRVRF